MVEANNVFLLDPWWNPAVEEQAIERVHRLGQIKEVKVIRFICQGTIEERMIEMHRMKREIFEKSVEGEMKGGVECFKYLLDKY